MTKPKKGRFSYVAESDPAEQELLAQVSKPAEKTESVDVPRAAVTALLNPEQFTQPPQRRGRKATAETENRMNIPREQMNIRIRPELKRAAAGLAGLQGLSLGDVVEAALVDYIKRHGQG